MKTVLIAIAIHKTRQRFSKILSEAGYEVIEADSGETALELAISSPPHLVLMAIVMPDINGMQSAARLHSRQILKTVPIILLGSVAPLGIDQEPLASIVQGYLDIDVGPEELLAYVTECLGR
jgi:CheY-like chemotaxis protein